MRVFKAINTGFVASVVALLLLATGSTFVVSGATTSSSLYPITPYRLEDTRAGSRIGAYDGTGIPLVVNVEGKGGIPQSGVTAVSLNVTVTDTVAGDYGGGFVTVYPCDRARPNASNLNFTSGQTVPNAVITPVSAQGDVCFYVYGESHLIVDVNGYYSAAERGPQGEQGPQGERGPQGEQGPAPGFYLVETPEMYLSWWGGDYSFDFGILYCPAGTVGVAANVYSPGDVTSIKLFTDGTASWFVSNDSSFDLISPAYAQLTCADDSSTTRLRAQDLEPENHDDWIQSMIRQFEDLHSE